MKAKYIFLFLVFNIAAFSSEKEHDHMVIKFREATERQYNDNIKIEFKNRPLSANGDPFIDPYAMSNFKLEYTQYDIFCFFRNSTLSPEVLFLKNETLHLYKGESPESTNIGFMGISEINDYVKSFYHFHNIMQYCINMFNSIDLKSNILKNELDEDDIKSFYFFMKRSKSYKKNTFAFSKKEKNISKKLAKRLSENWKRLKNITPEKGNEIDVYENLYYKIDSLNKYNINPPECLTYFEEILLLNYFFKESNKLTEDEKRNFYYIDGKYGSTVYELGYENKIFGTILPTIFYDKKSIPVLAADIVEFIKNSFDDTKQEKFDFIINKKLEALEYQLDAVSYPAKFTTLSGSISKYYDAVEKTLNKEYKIKFIDYPLFLKKENYKKIHDLNAYFENGIFDIFEDSKINQHAVFCLSNFDNKYVVAFYLNENKLTFISVDQEFKQKKQNSIDSFQRQIEKIALENNDSNIQESKNNLLKIEILNKNKESQIHSFNKCLIEKTIELPSGTANILREVWNSIDFMSYEKINTQIYNTHFPNLFGNDKHESYFQKCMKKENLEKIACPNRYMISVLGHKGDFIALNLPSCFFLTTEIPYQINNVITQIYLLEKQNTKENQEILKISLTELQNNLKNKTRKK